MTSVRDHKVLPVLQCHPINGDFEARLALFTITGGKNWKGCHSTGRTGKMFSC